MQISISFDVISLLGIVFLGYLASLVGNVVGMFFKSMFQTRESNGLFILVSIAMAVKTTPIKLIIAFITALVTLSHCATPGDAATWTMGITAGIGFLFVVLSPRM